MSSSQEQAIKRAVEIARSCFNRGTTIPISGRQKNLTALLREIEKSQTEIYRALKQDLNKSRAEAYMSEISLVKAEIKHLRRRLPWLAMPRPKLPALSQLPGWLQVQREPYGVVLVMSPWNYPFQLTMEPIAAAIAGGNTVVVKPSAYTPHTCEVIERILRRALPPGMASVIRGGRAENTALLEQRFDHIFFTGSPAVGRVVMEAASRYLTPVTLELGGKSPCFVDRTANIDKAARRILFGKLLNAGQTCVSVDYVYVHEDVREQLIAALQAGIARALPSEQYRKSAFVKIISPKHFSRLSGLLAEQRLLGAKGGGHAEDFLNRQTQQIKPVIVDNPSWDSPVMSEEIFGPILPVLPFKDLEATLADYEEREHPLALYIFTKDRSFARQVMSKVNAGGVCINDTLLHMSSSKAPFGGVGNSGMGNYHGDWSFKAMTREQTVLRKSWLFDIPVRHHPYGEKSLKILRYLLR